MKKVQVLINGKEVNEEEIRRKCPRWFGLPEDCAETCAYCKLVALLDGMETEMEDGKNGEN